MAEGSWDYVIVGAGSAGCVLANRLSANPATRVLLLEAGGGDRHPYIAIPRGHGKLLKDPRHTWYFGANDGAEATTPAEIWVRGKVLGGSSSVNGMIYIHGQPQDYDEWAALGATGWGWNAMRRVFQAIEDHELGANETRGSGGPLHISISREHSPACDAVIAAGTEMGVPARADLNGEDQEGLGYTPQTMKAGRRVSASRAFLKPALGRPNLRVVTGAEAERVVFDRKRATGVRYVKDGTVHTANARGEVILCAGAIHSPKLLQLSGIGHPEDLMAAGVETIVANRDVGRNLREHRIVTLQFALPAHRYSHNLHFAGPRLWLNALRYAVTRRGSLASSFTDVVGFVKTRPGLDRPDGELQFAPYSIDLDTAGTRGGEIAFHKTPGMSFLASPLRPESKGWLKIKSPNASMPLEIHANYLAEAYDRDVTIGLVHFVRKLVRQPALTALAGHEIYPGGHLRDDAAIIEHALKDGQCGYHTVGTCRMGGDDAVLDPALRVRGATSLRVVDASVMPTMVSGNTNGPTMAIAWRAADIILAEVNSVGHR